MRPYPEAEREGRFRESFAEETSRPFDLTTGPLLRTTLYRHEDDVYTLLVSMHHIISDGWSIGVLTREMGQLYEAFAAGRPSPLPELPIQYADYAVWQQQWLKGAVLEKQSAYWREKLGGELPVLQLPTDRPRPPVQRFKGATHFFVLPQPLTEKLRTLSRQENATLFMLLLAAFDVLLYRQTGQEDLVVGVPIANRHRGKVEPLIGFFVNTLALRADLSGNPSFRELLGRVKDITLEAYAHQDVPLEKIVEELQPERNLSHTPLFQVMLALQNVPMPKLKLPELEITMLPMDAGTSKFDLTLALTEEAGALAATLEYSTDLFEAATIERLSAHFINLLESIVRDPSRAISELEMLSAEEQRQLLVEWNQTSEEYDAACLHHLIEAQVERTPDAVAVSFNDEQVTYQELNERANQVAHHLRSLGVGAEKRVGILMERSIDLIVALLGTLKSGAAYVPLDPTYPPQRLSFMLSDSQADVLLSREQFLSTVPDYNGHLLLMDKFGESSSTISTENLKTEVLAENAAYLIYTSGSTGRPKGVAITHRNAAALLHWAQRAFSREELSSVLASTSVCFDLSIFELFVPLSIGGRVVLVENALSVVELPPSIDLKLINTVPSAMTELLRMKAVPASVTAVNLAGEALSGRLVRDIYEQTAVQVVRNLYGPSEDTTYSTWTEIRRESQGEPTIGRPVTNTRSYILGRRMEVVARGVAGELYLGGEGISRGYLNRPEMTAERYVPDPFGRAGERLYRTGDLARYRADGEIEFLGRIDTQVKVRGYRIELGEIEAALSRHPGLKESAVLVVEDKAGDDQLVAYIAPQDGSTPNVSELRNFLKLSLPDYMIPSAFVTLPALPKTSSGKIDRRALTTSDAEIHTAADEYSAPRTPVEEMLAGIWGEVLRVERVGIHDNFFDLGGHSLLATRVMSKARAVFNVEIPLRALFERPTVAELAETVEDALRGSVRVQTPALRPVARQERMPLSFSQQRLWFLDQLKPGSAAYNIPAAVRFDGVLNIDALHRSLNEIVRRHEALRTTFTTTGEQTIRDYETTQPLELPLTDLSGLPETEREEQVQRLSAAEAAQPFDLTNDMLLRVKLLRLGEEQHVMLVTMHHIISDGWSAGIFIRELSALYTAFSEGRPSPLPELPIQYADFAVWQRELLQGEVLDTQLDYWKKQLANPTVLELPTDRARPPIQTFNGANRSFSLDAELAAELQAVSRRNGGTLFMTLLAALKVLLHRYSRQEDIIIGTPIANRNRVEIEGLIGFFVNTLVMRTDLSGNPSFQELLLRVREAALSAYAHQDLPFEKLVEELQLERDLSRNPLFQVMFVFQDDPLARLDAPGLKISQLETDSGTAMFDLTLYMVQRQDGRLTGTFNYNTALFDEARIDNLIEHFRTLLAAIASDPARPIASLPLLHARDEHRLLREWNETAAGFPSDKSLHELFEAQAQRTPDAVALISEEGQITYGELNQRANRLAQYLRKLGIAPEAFVGVHLERSVEMVVGILGILKAGGAYVPLDPAYPQERLTLMLEDARPQVVLTRGSSSGELVTASARIVNLDADWEIIARESDQAPPNLTTAENLAYLIYTSGSTGRPKAVLAQHRSVVNRLQWMWNRYPFEPGEVCCQKTSLSFVDSIWEIFGPLLQGVPSLILKDAQVKDVFELIRALSLHRVTRLVLVPSLLNVLLDTYRELPSEPLMIKTWVSSGEALSSDLARKFKETFPEARLLNLYGSSEVSADVTCYDTSDADDDAELVAIGRPIANTQIYLLDDQLQPVPVGVPGEIYVGGSGLARGYHHHPDFTALRFVPDPYGGKPGARLYKTGDLARYRRDGQIEYLGRTDQQVKIRGYRIEPEEIETALRQYPHVKDAVVTAVDDARGGKRLVAYVVSEQRPDEPQRVEKMQFSLFYFAADETNSDEDKYQLYIEGAKFADRHGFTAVWTPERHFHHVAGLYPNPSVLNAALAMVTEQIQLRAGSVVMPLHHPMRVAEEWAVVDNLSKGRVGLSFTSGWVPNDFAFYPEHFANKREVMYRGIEQVRKLWRGEAITVRDGAMNEKELKVFPHPVQPELPIWLTCTGDPETFIKAGEIGAHVLTALLGQTVEEAAPKIALYRESLIKHGYDPSKYHVTMMLHTFVAPDTEEVLSKAREPFRNYMKSHVGLIHTMVKSLNLQVNLNNEKELDDLISFAFERYYQTASLIGTPAKCMQMIERMREIGVDEVACLIDFGVEFKSVMEGLNHLNELKEMAAQAPVADKQSMADFLRRRLAEYMIPSAFVSLDALPLLPNGKVNRRALPAPDALQLEQPKVYVAPSTPTEMELAEIWAEVLGIERVGLNDNFFDIGGHSLMATQLISRVRAAYPVELSVKDLFAAPTLGGMAEMVEEGLLELISSEGLDERLAMLSEMNEEQAQALLDRDSNLS
ncbi:MAG TPA: amino acid adenylation domain-containing protein [Pyrinomonadaceae bacterium]|nr:amino acid adenylation domain-containing protein [Pyrinomonadaceae bacterium]